jgi:hypothetical protein
MFKRLFYHGLSAGILASVAAIIYNRIYIFAFETNFSKLVNIPALVAANLLSCLIAAVGFGLLQKWFASRAEIIFNLSFSILSFASITFPLAVKLPLDIQSPELFPGLTIPMHFFPALAWMTISPLFRK